MAHLFRPKYTQKIPLSGAEFTTRNKIRHVSWTGKKGKKITGVVSSKDPTRCTITTDCWWIEYRDHEGKLCREKAFTDERASIKKMHAIEDRIEAIKGGNLSPASQHRAGKLLCDLIAEWRESMEARDVSANHIRITITRATRVCDAIEAVSPADITPSKVAKYLKSMRERKTQPISPQTSNHYLTALHSFTHWCVSQRYIDADPLATATLVEVNSRRTFERRALTIEEIQTLLTVTKTYRPHRGTLEGPARAALYTVAIYTGLRAAELASLTRADFQLAGTSPMISVHARSTKNKKGRHQPIPIPIAEALMPWLETTPTDGPVWAGSSWKRGRAASLLRADLRKAKIKMDGPLGKVDFHSLRTTYATLLALAGVPIQHAQRLMDHSDPGITARHYTKLLASDLSGAVGKMALPE
jgi:integrase